MFALYTLYYMQVKICIDCSGLVEEMTDNKNPKFPYIVLPNLSSAGDGDNITDDSSIG